MSAPTFYLVGLIAHHVGKKSELRRVVLLGNGQRAQILESGGPKKWGAECQRGECLLEKPARTPQTFSEF